MVCNTLGLELKSVITVFERDNTIPMYHCQEEISTSCRADINITGPVLFVIQLMSTLVD
jgi:hypothetical protein